MLRKIMSRNILVNRLDGSSQAYRLAIASFNDSLEAGPGKTDDGIIVTAPEIEPYSEEIPGVAYCDKTIVFTEGQDGQYRLMLKD